MMPSPEGCGVSMRSFRVLQTLATNHQVHLVCVEIFAAHKTKESEQALAKLCESITWARPKLPANLVIRFMRFIRGRFPCLFHKIEKRPLDYACASLINKKSLDQALCRSYEKIFAFKLYLDPVTKLFIEASPGARFYQDVDDIESITRIRIARLYREHGKLCEADLCEAESAFYLALETSIVSRSCMSFVSSEIDRQKFCRRTGGTNIAVLPNVYPTVRVKTRQSVNGAFTFLFIGSFGYFPNHDAAVWLCENVIPKVVASSTISVSFRFVGAASSHELKGIIKATQGAEFIGPTPDIESAYSGVNAVVVPIRAGGGTRIKLLEAFSFGVPAVSTTMGMEGIDCEPEVHILLADTSEKFAAQCLRLIESSELRRSLCEAGRELLDRKYQPGMINQCLNQLPAETLGTGG